MRRSVPLAAILAALSCSGVLLAGALLTPTDAPEWTVSSWINGDPGKLADQRGKVVLIEFFQLWCPVCNRFSAPLFKRWDEKYGGRDDVRIVSIHTVFEGHDVQTAERLREFVERWEIQRPVGIDFQDTPADPLPATMEAYENEGTPQVAIVDKFGLLRWSHFGEFDPRPVEAFIDRLLLEKTSAPAAATTAESKSGRSARGGKTASGPPAPRGRTPPPARETSRRPPPTREDPGEEQAEEEDAEQEEEEPEDLEAALSGKYRVTFQQGSKSCGELLPPQTVFVDIAISGGQMLVKFSRRYLEQQELTLEFDPGGKSFGAQASGPAQDRGAEVQLGLSASGRFVDGSQPPELEFQFRLEETSADGSADCTIEGTGTGAKSGA